jgi:hypothetical protein
MSGFTVMMEDITMNLIGELYSTVPFGSIRSVLNGAHQLCGPRPVNVTTLF